MSNAPRTLKTIPVESLEQLKDILARVSAAPGYIADVYMTSQPRVDVPAILADIVGERSTPVGTLMVAIKRFDSVKASSNTQTPA